MFTILKHRRKTFRLLIDTSVTYQYFRFTPTELRDDGSANSVQLSEFQLFNGSTQVTGATATNPSGDNPSSEQPSKAVDGSVDTKWLDLNKGSLVLTYSSAVTIDNYRWATANDSTERDPIRWTLEGSADGTAWTLIDDRTNEDQSVTTDRKTYLANIDINIAVATFATSGMTLDATYNDSSTDYSTLNDSTSSSAKVTCNFDKDDTGIIMEHGGTGDGLVLYIYNETLYFQCGDGGSAGGDSNTGEVSYTVTDTSSRDFIIEWSADISGCALYVDKTLIGTDVFSNDQLAGGNYGTIGTAAGNNVAVNRGSYPPSNTFSGTVTSAEIFLGEVTSDVSGL